MGSDAAEAIRRNEAAIEGLGDAVEMLAAARGTSDSSESEGELPGEEGPPISELWNGRLDVEARDASWAPAQESRLRALADGIDGVVVGEVTCRSSICRVSFDETSRQGVDEVFRRAQEQGLLDAPGRMRPDDARGESAATMWLGREGHPSPFELGP
jgi:hypothetical protein